MLDEKKYACILGLWYTSSDIDRDLRIKFNNNNNNTRRVRGAACVHHTRPGVAGQLGGVIRVLPAPTRAVYMGAASGSVSWRGSTSLSSRARFAILYCTGRERGRRWVHGTLTFNPRPVL